RADARADGAAVPAARERWQHADAVRRAACGWRGRERRARVPRSQRRSAGDAAARDDRRGGAGHRARLPARESVDRGKNGYGAEPARSESRMVHRLRAARQARARRRGDHRVCARGPVRSAARVACASTVSRHRPSPRMLEWATPFAYAIACFLLFLLLFIGTGAGTAAGTKSWIAIGGHRFGQPAELAKLAVVLMLARWLAGLREPPATLRDLIPP